MVGKTREPGEKPPQACTEQANRVDITKHKCRDIGLPDGMGVPIRQAAQGDGSTGTTLSGHCAILVQCSYVQRRCGSLSWRILNNTLADSTCAAG